MRLTCIIGRSITFEDNLTHLNIICPSWAWLNLLIHKIVIQSKWKQIYDQMLLILRFMLTDMHGISEGYHA